MAPEVKTEFKVDDKSSETLSKIQKGFEKVDSYAASASTKIMDFAKSIAATAIGTNLGSIIGGFKDLGTSGVRAAIDAKEQMNALNASVQQMSVARNTMQTFNTQARQTYDELSRIADVSGKARSELISVFTEASKNTVKTRSELTTLIEKASQSSRAMGVPVNDIVQGFLEIEKNTISANNPIIAMVKQANIMRGHSEQIAIKMQALGKGGMIKLANQAMAEMQKRAQGMPKSIAEIGNQFANMKEDMLQTIGTPMLNELLPALTEIGATFKENKGEIIAYAKMAGKEAGVWIREAFKYAREAFQYLNTHSAEIKAAVTSAFSFAKSTFQWILDHKEILAAGLVAGKMGGFGAAASAAGSVASGAGAAAQLPIGELFKGGAAQITGAFGNATNAATSFTGALKGGISGLAGLVGPAGALALAFAGVAAAVIAFQGYLKETNGYLSASKGEQAGNLKAQMDYAKRVADDATVWDQATEAEFERIKKSAIDAAKAIGQDTAVISQTFDAAYAKHQEAARVMSEATKGFQSARDIANSIGDMSSLTGDAFNNAGVQQLEAAKAFTANFQAAVKANDQGAINAMISVLQGSKNLQTALLASGQEAGLAFDKLGEVVGDKIGEFGNKLMDKAASIGESKALKEKGAVPTQVFNGGQTFNIKQDFRDQDPDRIITVFQRDIARVAENRLQAKTALPFGG